MPGTLESLLSPVLKDTSRNEEAEKHSNGCSGLPESVEWVHHVTAPNRSM